MVLSQHLWPSLSGVAMENSPSLQDNKRQTRRRKLLDNAKSRMEKLKNLQRSPTLAEEYEKTENREPVNMHLDADAALDPPDEVIPPRPTTESLSPAQTSSTHDSRLSKAVSAFSKDVVWWLRTALSLLCALVVVVLETSYQLNHSGVVLMSALDSALLFYAVLTHHPSQCSTSGNPLGKVSLLKIPLMMVHPAIAEWFDSVCLSLLLIALVLRDILLMIFTSVVLWCSVWLLS